MGGSRQCVIGGDKVFDLDFQRADPGIKKKAQRSVHVFEGLIRPMLLARLDLRKQPPSCFYQLAEPAGQRSEKAYLLSGQLAPSLWSEGQEPCNQFCVYSICLRACASAGGKGFDLRRRQLACFNPSRIKRHPEPPLLPAGRLETNDYPRPGRNVGQICMTFSRLNRHYSRGSDFHRRRAVFWIG